MSFLDFIIVIILLWGAYKGWKSGLLRQLVSLLGLLVGLFVASILYKSFGDFLAPHLGSSPTMAHVLAFVVLWVVVPIVLSALVALPSKWIRGSALGVLNNVLGLLVGVVKYLVLLSCLFWMMGVLGIISQEKRDQSLLYKPVKSSVGFLLGTDKAHSDSTTVERE